MGLLEMVQSKKDSIIDDYRGLGDAPDSLYSPKKYRYSDSGIITGLKIMGVEDSEFHEIWLSYFSADTSDTETIDMRAAIFWQDLGNKEYSKDSNISLRSEKNGSGTLVYRQKQAYNNADFCTHLRTLFDELIGLLN